MGGMGGIAGGEWCLNTAGLDAHKDEAQQNCSSGFCFTTLMRKKTGLLYFIH